MKPKTKIQKEVARLSANLRPISATQIDWAYRHCVEHIGYRTKKGNITCSDCGHEWHSDSGLCDTLEGCTCPKCHAELKVQDTRRRIYKETQNFSVITTCKGHQDTRGAVHGGGRLLLQDTVGRPKDCFRLCRGFGSRRI